jgi:Holliday junction DNA helicase RuvA
VIGYLRGQVIDKHPDRLLLDVGGVGYLVLVTSRLVQETAMDATLAVYTHLAVREDALTLYGFSSVEEKSLFESLVGVSGIGPKLGLAILSAYSPAEVQAAVSQADAAVFSAVSGIGKKNAERIVLELENKVWSADLPTLATGTGGNPLHQALISLGYSAAEAVSMSAGVGVDLPLSEQIKSALKQT